MKAAALKSKLASVLAGRAQWLLADADAMELMQQVPTASLDAVITDPPFFLVTHAQSTTDKRRSWSDASMLKYAWCHVCDEVARVLKPHGHFLVFCNADSYPLFFAAMYDRWEKLACLVWDKEIPGLGTIWRHQHELIIAGRNAHAWFDKAGPLRRDILRCKPTPSKRRIHRVHKPVALLKELIETVCPAGGIVGDPFAGSGSTGRAALECGRRFVGADLNPECGRRARAYIGEAA